MSSKDDGVIKLIAFILFGGGYLFYQGLRKYKIRQHILNVPRSKIASAALGNFVEVHGHIHCEPERLQISPLTNTKCGGFVWVLEEYVSHGKDRHWEKKFTYFGSPFFFIRDDSGAIAAVDFSSCEFHDDSWTQTEGFHSDNIHELPAAAAEILKRENMVQEGSGLYIKRYRLKEKVFLPEESVFVLGKAIETPKLEAPLNSDEKQRFGSHTLDPKITAEERFKTASTDCYVISTYDVNRNLVLDKGERERLYEDILTKVRAELSSGGVTSYLSQSKFLFTLSDINDLLAGTKKVLVSSKSEEDLVKNLTFWIWLGITAGPVLIAIGAWFLALKLDLI